MSASAGGVAGEGGVVIDYEEIRQALTDQLEGAGFDVTHYPPSMEGLDIHNGDEVTVTGPDREPRTYVVESGGLPANSISLYVGHGPVSLTLRPVDDAPPIG
jgi:hypothetical protein